MGHPKISLQKIKELAVNPWAWAGFAFLLRMGFALMLGERFYQADEGGYMLFARSIAEHGVFGENGAPRVGTPLAPTLFGVSYYFGGVRLARLVQALVSALTVVGIGRLTLRASKSEAASVIAMGIAAIYPFFVYYSGMLLSETLYVACSVFALWATLETLGDRGRELRWAGAAGLLWAAAGLTRTEGVPIALFMWLFLAGLCWRRRYSWSALGVIVLLWVVPLLSWAARNRPHVGKFTLDLHGGMTMLHGTLLYDIDQMDTAYSQQAFELTRIHKKGDAMTEADRDAYFMHEALLFMRNNPGTVLRQWVQKGVAFWRFYPRLNKVYPDTATAQPNVGASRRMMTIVSLLFEPALILGGFWGMWLMRRRFWEIFPLYWMVLATFGVHVIVVSQMRYRLPVMPVMILFAAYARASLLAHAKTRRR
jgi:4-amino-4-deoxy-L-arabinose transferase-like glycosyltransferase